MATMIIENWNTYCSACGKSANWDKEGHLLVLGYGDQNGTPGCLEPWEAVTMPYALNSSRFRNREYPHFPDWIYDLPYTGGLYE